MTLSIRSALALVAALSVSSTAADAAEPAPSALTGNVLVWADAPLYPAASSSGPSVRVGTLDLGREHDVGYVVPMKVVGTQGDFIEVEPTADVECVWWRLVKPDGLANLRLYVNRADLAPVLTKPFTASYKDGSKITLQPGVPVLAGKVAFNRGIVPIAIPEASIGLAYTPKKIAAIPKLGKTRFLLDEKTDVKLGTSTFPLGPWVTTSAKRRGDRMLVSLAARCMTAIVSAPKDRVHAGISIKQAVATAGAEIRRATIAGGTERYYLPAGTKLTSETGDHVVGTLEVDRDVAKPKPGARACAELVITREDPFVDVPHTVDAAQPARTLKLCAPADAVKTQPK